MKIRFLILVFTVFVNIRVDAVVNTSLSDGTWVGATWSEGRAPISTDTVMIDTEIELSTGISDCDGLYVTIDGVLNTSQRLTVNNDVIILGQLNTEARMGLNGNLTIKSSGRFTNGHRFDMISPNVFRVDSGGVYIHNSSNPTNTNRYSIFEDAENDFDRNSFVIIKSWDEDFSFDDKGMDGDFGNLSLEVATTGTWYLKSDFNIHKVKGELVVGTNSIICNVCLNNSGANSIDSLGALKIYGGTFFVRDGSSGFNPTAELVIEQDLEVTGTGFPIFRGIIGENGKFILRVGGVVKHLRGTFGPISTGVNPKAEYYLGGFEFNGATASSGSQFFSSANNSGDTLKIDVQNDMVFNCTSTSQPALISSFGNSLSLNLHIGGDLVLTGDNTGGLLLTSQTTGDETITIDGDLIVNNNTRLLMNGVGSNGGHAVYLTIGGEFDYSSIASSHLNGVGGVLIVNTNKFTMSQGELTFIGSTGEADVTVGNGGMNLIGGTLNFHASATTPNPVPVVLNVNGNYTQSGGVLMFENHPANPQENMFNFLGDTFNIQNGSITCVNPNSSGVRGNLNFRKSGVTKLLKPFNLFALEQTVVRVYGGTELDVSSSATGFKIPAAIPIATTLIVDGMLKTGDKNIFADGPARVIVGANGIVKTSCSNGLYGSVGSSIISTNGVDYFLDANSTVVYEGAGPQVVSNYFNVSGDVNHQYGKLEINNTGVFNVDNVALASNTTIRTELMMTQGVLQSTPFMLSMNNGGISNAGNSQSYVDGPFTKLGNNDFTFPLGNQGKWAPLGVSGIIDASQTFVSEYHYNPFGVTLVNPPLNNVSVVEWWDLSRLSGTSAANVEMHWKKDTESGIDDGSLVQVAHFNGTEWDNEGNNISTTGAEGSVIVNGVNSFSPFTFGSLIPTSNPLTPIAVPFSNYYVNSSLSVGDIYTTSAGVDLVGCGSSNNPCASISYLIANNELEQGDTVFIDEGVYNDVNVTISNDTAVFMGVGVSKTVFDGSALLGNSNRLAYVQVPGVEFQNLKVDSYNNTVGGNGGAFYVEDVSGLFRLENVEVNACQAINGGALAVSKNSIDKLTIDLSSVLFTDGFAVSDGGVGWFEKINGILDVNIDNSTFGGGVGFANSADGDGGALLFRGDSLKVYKTIFQNNSAGNNGGAIIHLSGALIADSIICFDNLVFGDGGAIFGGVNTSIQIRSKSEIGKGTVGNNANRGAGVYFQGANLLINDVSFLNNSAEDVSNAGGGIFLNNSFGSLNGVTFNGNQAISGSGGGVVVDNSFLILDSCVMDNNTALSNGGAIKTVGAGNLVVSKSEIGVNGANTGAQGGAIKFDSDTLLISDGSVFENNLASATGTAGGAIQCGGGSTVIIDSTLFDSNQASAVGGHGGALALSSSLTYITNSEFTSNNSGNQGGAIWAGNGNKLVITDSTIIGGGIGEGNVANNTGSGGAIWFSGDSLIIGSSEISFNSTVNGSGGAILMSSASVLYAESVYFEQNVSGGTANGGVLNLNSSTTKAYLVKCEIENNTCGGNGLIGNSGDSLWIINSLIYDNSIGGTGIVFGISTSHTSVFHSTIVGNSGSNAGVLTGVSGTAEIWNSILRDNQGVDINEGGNTIDVRNTFFESGTWSGVNVLNVTSDPLFVNEVARDFTLQNSSPAIDYGDASVNLTEDFEGNVRPVGAGLDAGAFESTVVVCDTTSLTTGLWTWTGVVDSNWFNCSNWDKGSLPNKEVNVLIPFTTNNPLISGDTAFAKGLSIDVDNGAELSIDVDNFGFLEIESP